MQRIPDGITPGTTVTVMSDNTANYLKADALMLRQVSGKNAVAILITCETNNVRIAWGADPTSAALGHVMVKDTEGILIENLAVADDLRYQSATDGSAGRLNITPFYRR